MRINSQFTIWQTTDSQIEKWFNFQKTVLIKFKISIAQLIAKISIRHWGVNQIRHSLTGYNHFLSKNKAYQWLSKSKFLNFMTYVNPSNGNKTTFFHGTYLNLTLFFISRKILKQWLFNSEHKRLKWNKSHKKCVNLSVFFLIYKVGHYLNFKK